MAVRSGHLATLIETLATRAKRVCLAKRANITRSASTEPMELCGRIERARRRRGLSDVGSSSRQGIGW